MSDAAKKPVKLGKKDFESDQDVRWCPGCGDYAILSTVQRTLAQLGVKRETTVFVSGIGCSSRFPYYMNTYGFHSIHGRAPAVASGLKIARPELDVWVITGDGDGLSIGGNHLMHALRRNMDLKILLFNNQIYGLTKGQYSPTSAVGTRAASTPAGSVDYPVNPVTIALGAGATFIARVADTDAKTMMGILERAYRHKGSVFIELLQNCPVFNDAIWDAIKDDPINKQMQVADGKPLRFGEGTTGAGTGKYGIKVDGAMQPQVVEVGDGPGQTPERELLVHRDKASTAYQFLLASLSQPEFPIPVGVLHCDPKPSYEQMAMQQIADAKAKQGEGDLEKLMYSGMVWEVGADGVKH